MYNMQRHSWAGYTTYGSKQHSNKFVAWDLCYRNVTTVFDVCSNNKVPRLMVIHKYGFAYKPIVATLFMLPLARISEMKSSSLVNSSIVGFYFDDLEQCKWSFFNPYSEKKLQNIQDAWNWSWKWSSHTNVFEAFKGSVMDVRTSKMIQGAGGHHGLNIQKWF